MTEAVRDVEASGVATPTSVTRLTTWSAIFSLPLGAVLIWAFYRDSSSLALAHSADAFSDAVTSLALGWAYAVSLRPPDRNHPFGHENAQPVTALVVAVLAAVMAVEVAHHAIDTLAYGQAPRVGWRVAAVLSVKVLIRGVFFGWSRRLGGGSVLAAFRLDAGNDILIALTSIVGLGLAHSLDAPKLDAWLSLPVAAWVGYSGFRLGLENIHRLMGIAAPEARQEAMIRLAEGVPGVATVAGIKTRAHGDHIHVWLEVHVKPDLQIAEAHDIGERVEAMLHREADVAQAVVHVDALVSPGQSAI